MRQFTYHQCSAVLLAAVLTRTLCASEDTIGPNGINATPLITMGLTGDGIAIGQVEAGRPGSPNFDTMPFNYHSLTVPTAVFRQDGPATPDAFSEIQTHAVQVASVMISTDASDPPPNTDNDSPIGVATDASLYASAYITAGTDPGYQDALVTTQHVAAQNSGDVRVINHSWGKEDVGPLNGDSLLTAGFDWIAEEHDVLHVKAGNEIVGVQMGGVPVPSDNYNGMTIAASAKSGNK
jgi:hypothetical protein